jgi:hypothetical protein
MRKIIALFVLTISIVACGQFQSSQQLETQTAVAISATSIASTADTLAQAATEAAWTPTPTSTPAIDYTAQVGISGAQLYGGPGENYSNTFIFTDKVTIVGQAYQCAWFKVFSNADTNLVGWVSADKISYSVKCSDVQPADYPPPPLPTSTDTPFPPTKTPVPPPPVATRAPSGSSAPSVSCQVNSNIIIQNRTGAPFTINLTGPGNFSFSLGASDYSTVRVCSGSYNYYIFGTCHGSPASGTGRISDGDQVYFQCN